jgi:putative transposase
MGRTYPSDLTDKEWKRVRPILDRFRFVKHDPRQLLNAMLYLVKSVLQWRILPESFPPWQTVYYHFRKWQRQNLFQKLCDRIRRSARVAAGRKPSPSAAIVDTQSVETGRQGGPGRGRDPSKRVKGRKRHVITDTLGLLLGVMVGPANASDGQRLPHLLQRILGKVPRLHGHFCGWGLRGRSRKPLVALFSLGASSWVASIMLCKADGGLTGIEVG